MASKDVDISYLTSRYLVMSFPAEGLESAFRNHIEDVRLLLDSKGAPYMVVNVSGRSYESNRFGASVKVLDGGAVWKDSKKVPTLRNLITLCDVMFKWASSNQLNTIVVHCMDGRVNSALLTISFWTLISLIQGNQVERAVKFFASKRLASTVNGEVQEPAKLELAPSHYRYLGYVSLLKNDERYHRFFSTQQTVLIRSVSINGIPLFTKLRDGCRPFVEIYSNMTKQLFSTMGDYDKLEHYTAGSASGPDAVKWRDINAQAHLADDIYLGLFHARAMIGSKMLSSQTKVTPIKMFSVQFNLFFELLKSASSSSGNSDPHRLVFPLREIDDFDAIQRFPNGFQLEIVYQVQDGHSQQSQSSDIAQNEILLLDRPECIFSTAGELEEFCQINRFDKPSKLSTNASAKPTTPKPSRPPPPRSPKVEPVPPVKLM